MNTISAMNPRFGKVHIDQVQAGDLLEGTVLTTGGKNLYLVTAKGEPYARGSRTVLPVTCDLYELTPSGPRHVQDEVQKEFGFNGNGINPKLDAGRFFAHDGGTLTFMVEVPPPPRLEFEA